MNIILLCYINKVDFSFIIIIFFKAISIAYVLARIWTWLMILLPLLYQSMDMLNR